MRKAPGFSVVVIVILALAMGANFHQAMAGDPQREVHGNQRRLRRGEPSTSKLNWTKLNQALKEG